MQVQSDIFVSFVSIPYIRGMELPAKRLYKGLAQLSRVDKIRVGLIVLGLTTEEAAARIGRSASSVRIALSQEEREGTLDRLESLLDDGLP